MVCLVIVVLAIRTPCDGGFWEDFKWALGDRCR
jgi:hypothetical protein